MLLILKKEQIEYERLRVLAQAMVNKEKGPEVFEEFKKKAFPWIETQKNRDRQSHIKILEEEIKRGVLGVRPLWENNRQIRSRLKTKVIDASEQQEQARRRSTADERKIYSKMGSLVPR